MVSVVMTINYNTSIAPMASTSQAQRRKKQNHLEKSYTVRGMICHWSMAFPKRYRMVKKQF